MIGGKVSRNLEILDGDAVQYQEFEDACQQVGLLDLVRSLPLYQTPSGGWQMAYRCREPVSGNMKLAFALLDIPGDATFLIKGNREYVQFDGDEYPVVERDGEKKAKTIGLETRGEGGYAIIPPTPAHCHPANRPYVLLRGDLTALPVLTGEERAALLNVARCFNECLDEDKRAVAVRQELALDDESRKPGTEYNERGDYEGVLAAHGWTQMGGRGSVTFWQRPGKGGPGISATTGYAGQRLFYNFSSNAAPFEAGRCLLPVRCH